MTKPQCLRTITLKQLHLPLEWGVPIHISLSREGVQGHVPVKEGMSKDIYVPLKMGVTWDMYVPLERGVSQDKYGTISSLPKG